MIRLQFHLHLHLYVLHLLFLGGLPLTPAFVVVRDVTIATNKKPRNSIMIMSSPSSAPETTATTTTTTTNMTIESATDILTAWDRQAATASTITGTTTGTTTNSSGAYNDQASSREQPSDYHELRDAIRTLNEAARNERERSDARTGRVMLGICAESASRGIDTLKSWVSALQLPRGLLHGMDVDGVPIQFDDAVYIKYNSGGVYTFSDIRKSGLGFDALWKPGDAMLEPYTDGTYRGVYFQVELADAIFRQFQLPLDVFDDNVTSTRRN